MWRTLVDLNLKPEKSYQEMQRHEKEQISEGLNPNLGYARLEL